MDFAGNQVNNYYDLALLYFNVGWLDDNDYLYELASELQESGIPLPSQWYKQEGAQSKSQKRYAYEKWVLEFEDSVYMICQRVNKRIERKCQSWK